MKDDNKDHNSVLYIIYNAIRPYGYEINNVLCLPTGFRHWCRFQTKYMTELLANNKLSTLPGKVGLIVLRWPWKPKEFVPIRWVKIVQCTKWAEIVRINYEVRDIVALDENVATRQKQLNDFRTTLCTAGDIENSSGDAAQYANPVNNDPKKRLMHLVFLGDGCERILKRSPDSADKKVTATPETELDNWMKVISELNMRDYFQVSPSGGPHHGIFNNFDFYKIVRVQDVHRRKPKPRWNCHKLLFRPATYSYFFNLRHEHLYTIEVIQRTWAEGTLDSALPGPMRSLSLETDPKEIDLVLPQHRLLSKYDVLEFYVRPMATAPSAWSFLELAALPQAAPSIVFQAAREESASSSVRVEDSPHPAVYAKVAMPIRITPGNLKFAFAFACTVLLILYLIFGDALRKAGIVPFSMLSDQVVGILHNFDIAVLLFAVPFISRHGAALIKDIFTRRDLDI